MIASNQKATPPGFPAAGRRLGRGPEFEVFKCDVQRLLLMTLCHPSPAIPASTS
jgi:hypothetical protein